MDGRPRQLTRLLRFLGGGLTASTPTRRPEQVEKNYLVRTQHQHNCEC